MSFITSSGKRIKIEFSNPQTRVYYSNTFDLFNFSDSLFLQTLSAKFENCFLIVGIEDPSEPCIMTLQEREEAVKRNQFVNQILSPAPKIDLNFITTYEIDHICLTSQPDESFEGPEDKIIIINPPVSLSKNELLARVVANRNKFLTRCLENGFSRRQLGASLFEKLSGKMMKIVKSEKWNLAKAEILKKFLKKGRKFYKKISKKIDEIEEAVNESLVKNFEE